MAKKQQKKVAAPTLRTALVGIQREGKRLADRVERDLRGLVRRTQSQLTSDAKTLRREVSKRVQRVTRELDGRAGAARREVERRLAALEEAVRSRLHVAGSNEVVSLKEQVSTISRRLEGLEERLSELTNEVHD
jgi:DNA anti-recombination protein RmuC